MPVRAKICGLSTPETVDAAIAGEASHLGFVFFPKSPRNVTPELAGALAARAQGRAKIVGLFVDPEPELIDTVRKHVRLDVLQLHGSEQPAVVGDLRMRHGLDVWKAIPVRTASDIASARKYLGSASHILFDAKPIPGMKLPGGNGLRFDWKLLESHAHAFPWILSGGLDARNVAEAVGITSARMVDVSSGVESAPGIKDVGKITAFLREVGGL